MTQGTRRPYSEVEIKMFLGQIKVSSYDLHYDLIFFKTSEDEVIMEAVSKSRSDLRKEWVDLLPQKIQDPSFTND